MIVAHGTVRLRPYVAVVVAGLVAWGCAPQIQQRSGQPPITSIEIGEGEAFVYLQDGVAARDVVGRDLFGPLSPGVTPEQAAANLGPPTKIESEGSDEVAYYETSGRRLAVVTRHIPITPTANSPRGTSYELRTFPPSDYAEKLPALLRDLVLKEPGLFRIVLVSEVSDDWRIRLMIRGQRLEYVVASPKSAERAALPQSRPPIS